MLTFSILYRAYTYISLYAMSYSKHIANVNSSNA